MSVGIIAAVSPEGVIGVDGDIPWHYPSDLKRFKRLTMGATVIMGRLTWESLPRKPLPGRRNVVVTRESLDGVECYRDVRSALESCTGEVWFIGGARIFEEAMQYADIIDLGFVPDRIESRDAVHFPSIDEDLWEAGSRSPDPDDERIERCVYRRRKERSKMSESKHQYVTGPGFPAALGPYSAAVTLGELVLVSGQGAAVPATGKLVGPDIETQTEQVFKNLESILKAAGSDLKHILRCGVFLLDMSEFSKMNAVYERMMDGHKPARTTVQAAALPMAGLRVEIDAIAYRR